MFVMAPVVADRTIEKSGWGAMCQANLRAEISERRSPPQIIPNMDCQSIFGTLMPELGALCRKYGNPDFGGPASALLRQQERVQREFENRRLARAASKTGSRCDCASAVVSENRAWALYAGSLRIISPSSTGKNLKSELSRALNAPICSMKGN